ncbi:MAG: hypothetical protein OEV31_04425 [Gammaproteobacteria bacterium]|nr:hypothetical protein [Gammaproteobacteria bacterium]
MPKRFMWLVAALLAEPCHASEELITTAHKKDGETIPYVLNAAGPAPRYVVILFPGGSGNMDPRMQNGKLIYGFKGNFVIRTRKLLVDGEFATVATNASQSEERIQAILDDLKTRYPAAQVYLMSTSKGTLDSMRLAGYLSDKIAGEIHTSSMNSVHNFDARNYKNRHLLVHHRHDDCHATPFRSAQHSHDKYGTELLAMDGGTSTGDVCEPFAHHGYNGIEKETITAIKQWIKQAPAATPR